MTANLNDTQTIHTVGRWLSSDWSIWVPLWRDICRGGLRTVVDTRRGVGRWLDALCRPWAGWLDILLRPRAGWLLVEAVCLALLTACSVHDDGDFDIFSFPTTSSPTNPQPVFEYIQVIWYMNYTQKFIKIKPLTYSICSCFGNRCCLS